jgi:hypothetical protein
MDHDRERVETAVIEHLQEIAHAKRAILQIARKIVYDYEADADTLLRVVVVLTRSADRLLGDTMPSEVNRERRGTNR